MILIKILLVVIAMDANQAPNNIEEQISVHGQWEDYHYELEQDKNYNINTNKVR